MVNPVAFVAIFAIQATAHGLLTRVKGGNGVTMPGLTVSDGVLRTEQNLFGQGDTAIMNDNTGPLGSTDGGGAVDPAVNMAIFMGKKKAPVPPPAPIPITGTAETGVADTAGNGAKSGLPTPERNGILTMTWFQVNRDGAGPLMAQLDTSSGGTNLNAFQNIDVILDVPGTDGESESVMTDFPFKVRIPPGTKCTGTVGGMRNVCIVRAVSPAGPWGGSVAFTTGGGATKRAETRRMVRRRIAQDAPLDGRL